MTQKKNVLFLLVDCLRADKCWGEERSCKTPTIDSLCQKGTIFSQAITTTTTTTPSVASILTGLYPFQHGVRSLRGYKLKSYCTTMAEILRRKGYNTYAEVSGSLDPAIGLDRGFDEYHFRHYRDDIYSEFGEDLLNKFQSNHFKEPWFVFVHFMALHPSNRMLKKFDRNSIGKNTYEKAVSSLDGYLGKLLEKVDSDAIIVLHADHGEKILEGKIDEYLYRLIRRYQWFKRKIGLKTQRTWRTLFHGFHVYEYLVRVPLILFGEGTFPEGKIITQQVRQIDILPTIVDALDLNGTKVEGRSLMPLINGEKMEELPACMEACGVVIPDKTKWLRGIRTSEYKFMYAPYNKEVPEELYDLKGDPDEKKNIVKERPEIAQILKKKLTEIYGEETIKERIKKLKMEGKI